MSMLEEILRQGLAELGLEADERAVARLRLYYERLEEKNRVMNLTAITGEEEVARLHFLDCAALLKQADFAGKRVIDVGSGAGFPGLVLKILQPEMDLTLLDSLDKRVRFLEELSGELGLEGVRCVHARAEEAPPEFRQGFDIACSRAVARLSLLSELCLPLVKPGGLFLAMKGPELERELEEAEKGIRLLGGQTEKIALCQVPGTDLAHKVLLVRKTAETPKQYPRRWAQIKKQPL